MKPTKQSKKPATTAALRLGLLAAMSAVATGQLYAQATAPTAPAPSAADDAEEAIVLSPFTVDATKDKGYYAENTLAGSRMKTNVSDLASSISVITKQQLEDTASVDINDVFRYEVNTEGSSTYTPPVLSTRSDGPADTNAGFTSGGTGTPQTNATSNRVRGLGSPSAAINYYPAISQVPMDSYNIERLEISRGPNSMLFGMGSPAGIVNQGYAQASLNRDKTSLQVRFDDRGSYRGSFNHNQGIIDDKLAIYVAGVWDERRFVRKPSYDSTNRQYGAITFKPFPKTVIRAMVENYDNKNRRPNSVTPVDFVTEWNKAGRPIYDSLARTVSRTGANGQTITVPLIPEQASPNRTQVEAFIAALPDYNPALWNAARTTYNGRAVYGDAAYNNIGGAVGIPAPLNPMYVPGFFYQVSSRTLQQIGDGQLQSWFQPLGMHQYLTSWPVPPAANPALFPARANVWANSTWSDIHNRFYAGVGGWSATFERPFVGSYKYPGVSDKSIYDWESVNVVQMNWGEDHNSTYNVELEQEIFDNLHFTAGWFRQDFDSVTNYTVAQLNATAIYIDPNKYLPDGTPNPYVGKPYVQDIDPDRFRNSEVHDHYRAMLAFTPDFTRQDNWMKWLGRHQILGLWSYQDSLSTFQRQRVAFTDANSIEGKYRYLSNQLNRADGSATGWRFAGNFLRRQYYLANPSDPMGVVTRGSGEWNAIEHQGNVRVYDYANSRFQDIGITSDFLDREEGTGRTHRQIESFSAGMTNYLWNERLVTTFGVRKDDYRARQTSNGRLTRADGTVVGNILTNEEKYVNGVYQTEKIFGRWNPVWDEISGTTRTTGAVLRPFRNWAAIDSRANSGNQFWQFIRDFGVSYNESDNFNAPPAAQVDAFGTPLPKPTGEGKDIGIQFTLFDNKVFTRLTWFEATNENERLNPGTSISRLTGNMDTTLFRNWARTIALINMGYDPRSTTAFGVGLSSDQEQQVQNAAEVIWKQDYDYYANVGNIFATRDAKAEGVELTVNYNPLPNWTMRLTASKQDTFNSNVLRQYDAWFEHRNPVWQAAKAADYLLPQYQSLATYVRDNGRAVNLTNFWTSYGFTSEVFDTNADGNTNVANYFTNVVAPQAALARDLNGQRVMGQRRYRGSFLTNYAFDRGTLKGFAVGGSQRWEDKAIIGYYGKSSGANTSIPNLLDLSDTTRPIWDKARFYTDLWVSYTRKVYSGKATMKLQFNVENAFEDGRLQVVSVNYDGSPYGYRIIDSRRFVLTAGLDF